MTEKEAMKSPLHEVWTEFQKTDNNYRLGLETAKVWSIAKGRPLEVAIKMNLSHTKPKWEMLRRVLLERCSKFTSTRFEVDSGVLVVTHRAKQVFWKSAAAKDIAAIYSFWAWEIEQRERESGKPVP